MNLPSPITEERVEPAMKTQLDYEFAKALLTLEPGKEYSLGAILSKNVNLYTIDNDTRKLIRDALDALQNQGIISSRTGKNTDYGKTLFYTINSNPEFIINLQSAVSQYEKDNAPEKIVIPPEDDNSSNDVKSFTRTERKANAVLLLFQQFRILWKAEIRRLLSASQGYVEEAFGELNNRNAIQIIERSDLDSHEAEKLPMRRVKLFGLNPEGRKQLQELLAASEVEKE